MSTEIERTKHMRDDQHPQPNPVDTLNAIAGITALTLGFLIGSQIVVMRNQAVIFRQLKSPQVKEVVVVYKQLEEAVT